MRRDRALEKAWRAAGESGRRSGSSTSCGARRTSRSRSPCGRCRRFSPPGLRFLLAGLLLAAILALRRTPLRTTWREARSGRRGRRHAARDCGVGVVTLAETRIDSSVAAMIAGSVPLQVIVWRTIAAGARCDRDEAQRARRPRGAGAGDRVPSGLSGGSTAVGLAMMLGAHDLVVDGLVRLRAAPAPA